MIPNVYRKPTIDLFDDLFGNFFNVSVVDSNGAKVPVHDVIENDKEYVVEMLLPGVKKEDVSISIEKEVMTIKAERKEIKDLKYNRKQTYFGKYERSFILPDDVDTDNIDASLNDGVLIVTVPKLETSKKAGKKIVEIK